MIKYNDNNIIVGHIKQLLTSFNLPQIKVYKNDAELIDNTYYIKDNKIQFYKVSKITNETTNITTTTREWKKVSDYEYNKKYKNFTKKLKITNNLYDSYTHEYLGNYLRFLRDYKKVDFMPLYNCFSNKIVEDLDLSFSLDNTNKELDPIKFDAKSQEYKIYMLPIKVDNVYTIAIDSNAPVEVCCSFYGKYQFSENSNDTQSSIKNVAKATYQKWSSLSFNKLELYKKLTELNKDSESNKDSDSIYAKKYEHDLKLFIKVPVNNKSSVVVLEGDYTNWTDKIYKREANSFITQLNNHFVTNFEGPVDERHNSCKNNPCDMTEGKYNDHIGYQDDQLFTPITTLQLLALNTKESYPFADSLIEYLLENAITEEDEIGDNIKRVAKVVNLNIDSIEYDSTVPEIGKINTYGIWTRQLNPILYNFMNENYNIFGQNFDNFGNVTKKVERLYVNKQEKTEIKTTIANADIYEGEL